MHDFTNQLLQAIEQGTTVARNAAALPQTGSEGETIQAELMGALGGAGGWKVSPWSPGATLSAAPIPQAWIYRSGDALPSFAGLRFEVEFALISAADGSFMIAPALELMRSRLEPGVEWPDAAKKADLLVTAGAVIGQPRPLPDTDQADCQIQLVGGDQRQTVTTSLSVQPLVEAARWTAEYAKRLGLDFTPGTVIITGARMGPLTLDAEHIRAEIAGFGAVEIACSGAGARVG